MTIILAIDTATGPCSAAIWRSGRIAAYAENIKPVMQSACLLPLIEQVLAESNTTYDELTAVACTVGPGSFTGIRVGLAAARGIAFAAGIPGIGATTLNVLAAAAQQHPHRPILAALNAGKGEYYVQRYEEAHASEAQLASPQETLRLAGGALIAGNVPEATAPITFPRADALATLVATGREFTPLTLTPFYIRDPDAKLPAA